MIEHAPIPVYQPSLFGNEHQYVNECMQSTWISSKGEFLQRFETAFADIVGKVQATTVCNGTVAIHLALEAIGLRPGDEVIVPSFTYVASVNPIIQMGAIPVYADSDPVTWNLDPEDVLRRITPKTKAVMAVHLYGLACDMPTLAKICKEHDLYLIEDCAEAFGSYCENQHVGSVGDIGTFSFFGNKTITTGEGGMVVSRHPHLIARAAHLKNQGVSQTREYWHDELAFNYRMTNIQAAIGLAQLERADQILAAKRRIAHSYQTRLEGLPCEFQPETKGMRHSYWMCSFLVESSELRDCLRAYLREQRIDTRPTFPPIHTLPHTQQDVDLPNAFSLSTRGINLPSYPDLTSQDIERICRTIRTFFESQGLVAKPRFTTNSHRSV